MELLLQEWYTVLHNAGIIASDFGVLYFAKQDLIVDVEMLYTDMFIIFQV